MQAAFAAAEQVVNCIEIFQIAGTSDDFGPQSLRQYVPAFTAALERLEAELSDEVLAKVRDRRPLDVGGWSARSYLEIVHAAGCDWLTALLMSADSGELGAWRSGEKWPAIDVEAVIRNWADWRRRAPLVGPFDTAKVIVGLAGEREALTTEWQNAETIAKRAGYDVLQESPAGRPAEQPEWNRDTGELTIGGKLAKRIQNLRQATNVGRILDVFQEENWPARIDDPLPDGRDALRLKAAIDSLNNRLTGLRFSRDGTGEGIRWTPAE